MKNISIYVHIPFCRSKCYYCDFYSCVKEENIIENYVDSVCTEILGTADILTNYNIETIYFGGGTPSYIDSKYIEKIMSVLNLFGGTRSEVTIEVNPKDCSIENLKKILDIGFDRFSIGLQSIDNNILKNIGRNQTIEDFEISYLNMTSLGIENISVDCITGLPGDDINSFKQTIDYIVGLGANIKHVSVYSLEVHENTKLSFLLKEGFLELPNEDIERDMKHLADKILEENGYKMYEISNYAKEGYESKHNSGYWLGQNYLGFGVAASSYILGSRYTNISDVKQYIQNIQEGNTNVVELEELTEEDLLKEWVMLRFRLNTGVSVDEFKVKFKKDIQDVFNNELNELLKKELIHLENDRYILTEKGRDLANFVFKKFV